VIQTIKKRQYTGINVLMTGCQAMTGETAGQNIDDGVLTSWSKPHSQASGLTPCHVWASRPTTALCSYRRSRDRPGEVACWNVASQVKGVRQVVNNLQVIKR